MEAAKHHGTMDVDEVEHAVGEPMHESATHTSVDGREGLGMCCEDVDDLIERAKEGLTQIGSAISVPSVGLGEVGLRLGSEPDVHSV